MLDFNQQPNYSKPVNTAVSAIEGRLKVDVSSTRKKKSLKKILNKKHGKI
jgi:hypothetical protein